MALFRGFVDSLLVRSDGWAEITVKAVHATNEIQSFFIRNLDGDITQTNKRLAQLGLLRDALSRVLPVQIDYTSTAEQGNVVDDVTAFPRPSTDGRRGSQQVQGVVVGLGVSEFGPLASTTPYRDAADLAAVLLLTDAGSIENFVLDLQRPDPLTAHAELRLLEEAHRTRRPVVLQIATSKSDEPNQPRINALAGAAATAPGQAFIVATAWVPVPELDLTYTYAFVERLAQRYESYLSASAPAISHTGVVYTTAPGQTPEGDISDNGSFSPQRLTAWVHDASPLLVRLETALRDCLQVKLGLSGDQIHSVDLVAHLGSVARPIWIVEECRSVPCADQDDGSCNNVPTISNPGASSFNDLSRTLLWIGKGFFQEGIWRFLVTGATGGVGLKLDGNTLCCAGSGESGTMQHAYLKGLHCVELELPKITCTSQFVLSVYRIR